jgi:opacity protein-like surface antigen
MRSSLSAAALLAALTTPLAAQDTTEHADHATQGGGTAPAGWTVRADKGDAKNAKVVSMGQGLHLTLGPAIILYRADTRGSGPFHTLATFTQTKPSKHAEGYGLFVGGQGLDGPAQKYIYFLVRQDGSYLIKRRDGEKTTDVSKGWVRHPAVKQPDAKGSATNLLEVDNKRDPSRIAFLVNGQEVYGTDAKGMALDGIVGIRANHNLDLHIEGFDVHR